MSRRDYKGFAEGEIHHVFNRGNNKMDIFLDDADYLFFLNRLEEALYPERNVGMGTIDGAHPYRRKRGEYVRKELPPDSFSLIAYCLMPNHFHFLILQKSELSISALMLKAITGYSKYFNKKYERVGSLFQDQFKSTRIEDNIQLLHTSTYIHNNGRTNNFINAPELYPYSSFGEYMNGSLGSDPLCDTSLVLDQFPNGEAYRQFVHESFEVTQRNKIM